MGHFQPVNVLLMLSILIGSRILGIDMDDDNELTSPIDEGSNGLFGETDDMSDNIPDFNDPSVGASDDEIDEDATNPMDEGSNGSFGEADESFDANPYSNDLSDDASNHDIEMELLPAVPF